MPRRARHSKRSVPVGPDDAEVFLDTDGTYFLIFNEPHYENKLLARAAWPAARRATWGHEWRDDMWPPVGAQIYDHVTATADEIRVWEKTNTPTRRLDDFRAAVAADIASVTAFRRDCPDAADEVDEYLELYVADLRGLLAIVEELYDPAGEYNQALALACGRWEKPSLRKRQQ